jgi:hypothetical protein
VLHNNAASVAVTTLDRSLRVLIAEGEPHWDNKFLVQLLRREPHVDVTTVHRVTTERYFRVLMEGAASEAVTKVFPESLEALAAFDVVLFGKGSEYFLDDRRVALLEAYVRDHGGGVVFSRGKPYYGSFPALARMEPVVWGTSQIGSCRWLPAEAAAHDGLFGDTLPGREDALWARLSPVVRVHACRRVKSFARVWVEGVRDESRPTRPVPLVIMRRFGNGVVATVNAQGLWQWDFFPRFEESGDLYKRFWVELVQWAATRADFLPGRGLSLRLSSAEVLPQTPVKAEIGSRFAGTNGAPPALVLYRGEELVQQIQPQARAGRTDRYEAVFSVAARGDYRVVARLGDESVRTALHVLPEPSELDEVSADPEALRRLAETSGGTVITAEELASTVAALQPRREEVEAGTSEWQSTWDRWWLLCLLAGLALAEWTIRRRNGLL